MAFRKTSTNIPPIKQLTYAVVIGLLVFCSLFLLFNIGYSLVNVGRILPGVAMNGISLSGLTREEAAGKISSSYRYPDTGSILLVDGEQSWSLKPVQLGFYLDPVASANSAYDIGRKGGMIDVLLQRMSLLSGEVKAQPTFVFNQGTAIDLLNSLAEQINQPLREASISIVGTQVVVQNGQSGRVLDVSATLDAVTRQIQSMQDGVVPLVVLQSEPVVLSAELQGELARSVLSQPLTLTILTEASGESSSLQVSTEQLAPLLVFEKVESDNGTTYQIAVSHTLMTAFLTSKKEALEQSPQNSRFSFNDDTYQLDLKEAAVIGRTLDIEGSISAINLALQKGEHTAPLSFTLVYPAVTDQMTGAELGITELVGEQFTYFVGSNADRTQNIATAAKSFHMLLVAPGETLSMADILGDISLDNGYAEALIILGDETIKGVGGGVCQVSTALFRTALYTGYPIVERHPHAYRVGYYEQINSSGKKDTDLVGMDATVFVPLVDFKFTNDTPYWLLMETYISTTNKWLQWKFYSTKDGREVTVSSSGLSNIVKSPDPVYRENSELDQGEIKQVDWAVEGADVTITRKVTRNGVLLYNDSYFTRYEAWGDVYEYGPGTEIPVP